MQRLATIVAAGEPHAGLPPQTTAPDPIRARFDVLHLASRRDPAPAWDLRKRRLHALLALLHDNAQEIAESISSDFGHRARQETELLELFPSLEAVRHALRHGAGWMRDSRRSTSLWFMPGSSKVVYQPLGLVGIIAPWNYPVYLTAGPLASALAAGNRVMVKLSEFTPATAALFERLAQQYFAPDVVAIVTGDAQVGADFSRLWFDHLLFTGSTSVGRHVMRAAADNLTPVTLELGGKSPAIVEEGARMNHAAERIVLGKMFNAGQTCIAPDYVLVHESSIDAFVAAARTCVARLYPGLPSNTDYSTIINARHFERLTGYVDDARGKGARIIPLSDSAPDALARKLPPIALTNVSDAMRIMQDEIFGPLLPIVPYSTLDDAMAYVRERPRPLALYYFGRREHDIGRVLRETHSGGVTINDVILHIAQDDLPFGGIGSSGMGHYHGRDGFLSFSKAKGVFRQPRLNAIGLFNPPYGKRFDKLIRLLLR